MTWLIWLVLGLQGVCLIVALFFVVRLLLIAINWKQHLPFVPSSRRFQRAMIATGLLRPAGTIVDLGCGTGTLLSGIARVYPQVQLQGVEHQRLLAALARWRFWRRSHVSIEHGDLFAANIREADAIVGFWIHDFMPRLTEKFAAECKSGCVIMSNTFHLIDHPRIKLVQEQPLRWGRLVVYQVQ